MAGKQDKSMTLSPRKTYLTPDDDAALRETLTEEEIRQLDRRLIKVGKDYHVYAAVDAKNATTKSRGLGDTIEKITTRTGIKAVVDKISKATGKDCGCSKRRDKLNKAFPYGEKETKA